jgi:cell division protein FtsB
MVRPVEPTSEMPDAGPSAAADKQLRRKGVTLALFLIVVASVFNALLGERGFLELLRARREVRQMEEEIGAIQAENQRLLEEVRSLKRDPFAIERKAREELGLVRPGEVVVMIRKGASRVQE